MSDKLAAYRDKRNFNRTLEPAGASAGAAGSEPLYVMHRHASSHDHFDLRLEQDGVLRSWALPRGPSLEPGEKRLAVEVEDHPLEYGQFEGIIPKGEYGGGTVMLWDCGRWRILGKPGRDKLDFELQGEKLHGRWTLARMRGKPASRGRKDSERNWLMIRRRGEGAETLRPDDRSVVSGRSMEEIAADADSRVHSAAVPDASTLPKARRAAMAARIEPQLASLVDTPPEGDDWLHEIKFDGYRLMARIEHGEVTLHTRNGKVWTQRFPEIARAMARLPVEQALIDGEIGWFEQDGSSNFRKLQDALGSARRPGRTEHLLFQAFDLLYLQGHDLRACPLLVRKEALAQLLAAAPGVADRVRYSSHIRGMGPAFLDQACELALEGVVSKRADAPYRSGRQRSWRKAKCNAQDEFVVGGYSPPAGARSGFGALLLGAYEGKRLIYTGRVGSGFTARQIEALHRRLKKTTIAKSPFVNEVPSQAGVAWVRPEVVVDVEFTERTTSGVLRHPVFRGVREDRDPATVKLAASTAALGEEAEAIPDANGTPGGRGKAARKGTAGSSPRQRKTVVAGVEITHPDRVMYPELGITKLDIARYYDEIQEWILPHLAHRPLSLLRCPEGWESPCFFQKHPGKTFGSGIPRIAIREKKKGGSSDYVYVTCATELVRLVQFGMLELHLWGSLVSDVEAPDTLIFDLDPGPDVAWRQIAHAATSLRERLTALGLHCFLQATGGKGLHLVVPVEPGLSWDEAKAFSHAVARAHARDDPKAFTTNMARSRRTGRVFIDYLRNGRGSTSIARYSLRARENAPVATPLRWNELTASALSNRYTLQNIRRRLGALKQDPWAGYHDARVRVTARMRKLVEQP